MTHIDIILAFLMEYPVDGRSKWKIEEGWPRETYTTEWVCGLMGIIEEEYLIPGQ